MKEKEKLAWIIGLTCLAGGTNVAALLLAGHAVSHYTGVLTQSAIALGEANWSVLATLGLAFLLFFLGSVLSGYIYHDDQAAHEKYHCVLSIAFGIVLIVSGLFFRVAYWPLFALGLGLQNGSAPKFNGVFVRTTHITGHLSDAARSLGKILRGQRSEWKKMQLYLCSILSYFTGAVIAAVLTIHVGKFSLVLIGSAYFVMGAGLAVVMMKREISEQRNVLDKRIL